MTPHLNTVGTLPCEMHMS